MTFESSFTHDTHADDRSQQSDISGNVSSTSSTSSRMRYTRGPSLAVQDKLTDLARTNFPQHESQNIKLESMKGGSNNRIVSITIGDNKQNAGKWTRNWPFRDRANNAERYILRIPRRTSFGYGLKYDVAALTYISNNTKLPVPELISYDTSADNSIRETYAIHRFVPGDNLGHELSSNRLNREQRQSALLEIMKVQTTLHSLTSKVPGILNPLPYQLGVDIQTQLSKFPIPGPGQTDVTSWFSESFPAHSTAQTTLELMLEMCDRWIEYDIARESSARSEWFQFKEVLKHMHGRGFLPDTDKFYFCHLDLCPRNILVNIDSKTKVSINGVLDWDADNTSFCPKFMAFRAPSYMWQEQLQNAKVARNEDLGIEEMKDESNAELEKLWEKTAGEEWLKYAYATEYILARRIFTRLLEGVFEPHHSDDVEDIVRRWKQLHPEDYIG